MNRYVKAGLAGYGPELDENDVPCTTMDELTEAIRHELEISADHLAEQAPGYADAGDFESAYRCRVRADELAIIAENLNWYKAKAPLYRGNPGLLTTRVEQIIAENFPLDVDLDGNQRLYVWEATG